MRTLPLALVLSSCVTSAGPPPLPPGAVEPAPTVEEGPSEVEREARGAAEAERHWVAAEAWSRVVRGEAPGSRSRALMGLGRALYDLDLPVASASVFAELAVEDPGAAPASLPWLAGLSVELPRDAGVLELVSSLPAADLERPGLEPVRDELRFALGRVEYQRGRLDEAVVHLGSVAPTSDLYPRSAYLRGVAEMRLGHVGAARGAFDEALDAVQQQRAIKLGQAGLPDRRFRRWSERLIRLRQRGANEQADRLEAKILRKTSWSSIELDAVHEGRDLEDRIRLARGYARYQQNDFAGAIAELDQIGDTSDHWPDALFASAWTEFRLSDVDPDARATHDQRVLGHVHTLAAPRFSDRSFPEASILSAITWYYNCRYPEAERAIARFRDHDLGLRAELEAVLSAEPEDYELFEQVRARLEHPMRADGRVDAVLRRALGTGRVAAQRELLRRIERERERLAAVVGDGGGPVVDEVGLRLDAAESLARERAGALLRAELEGSIREVRRLERQALKIEYEIVERLKHWKPEERESRRLTIRHGPRVDDEHEVYHYDGTYWDDELGFYYHQIENRCPE